jgi:hypothetical protein
MCDDVAVLVAELEERKIGCDPVQDQGYRLFTKLTLPGGGGLGVYRPRHARPEVMVEAAN